MKPELAALVLHHGHSTNLLAIAHGSQGQGPRIALLAVAAIICAVVISMATSRKKS